MVFGVLAEAAVIAMLSWPGGCLEPCDIRLRLTVEKAADNEKVLLEIKAEDSPFERVSHLPYGQGSPRTVEIWYKAVPRGSYTITATLFKHDGKTWVAGKVSRRVNVAGVE